MDAPRKANKLRVKDVTSRTALTATARDGRQLERDARRPTTSAESVKVVENGEPVLPRRTLYWILAHRAETAMDLGTYWIDRGS